MKVGFISLLVSSPLLAGPCGVYSKAGTKYGIYNNHTLKEDNLIIKDKSTALSLSRPINPTLDITRVCVVSIQYCIAT